MLASSVPIAVPRSDFETMLDFARILFRLKRNPAYVALLGEIPQAARVEPETPSILMGFDFHLTAEGPKLIEINNNAGGLHVGNGRWIPQPQIAELPGTLFERLLAMFPARWRRIAIVDDHIREQFMYPEMAAYAELLRAAGRRVSLNSPEELRLGDDGLYADGERLDAIYNRHTDFYLETPQLRDIRTAFERGWIELNPHPRSYALLGDKARMVDWWHEGLLESCAGADDIALIRRVVPEIHRLDEYDPETAWKDRNRWVFKPAARHGGKGVLLGKSVSRKRFDELGRHETVMQQFVPASEVECNGQRFKFDMRLFMQAETLVAVGGRVWQGQVTNFRAEGSGWVPLVFNG